MYSKPLPLPNDWKGNVGSILFLKSVRKEMDVSKNRGTQNGWFLSWKTLLKLMILGYHYFWKHPNGLPKGLSKWFKLTTVWICEQWAFLGDEISSYVGDSFINHNKDPVIKQPVCQWLMWKKSLGEKKHPPQWVNPRVTRLNWVTQESPGWTSAKKKNAPKANSFIARACFRLYVCFWLFLV